MLDDRRVAAVLAAAQSLSFRGHLYRVIAEEYRGDPLSGIGAVIDGGRFNPPGKKIEALYASDSRVTALFEVNALYADREEPRSPDLVLTFDVALERTLDLCDSALLESLGLTRDDLLAPWLEDQFEFGESTSQHLGRLVFESKRFCAIRVPSAARENADNFVVFPRRFSAVEFISIYDPRKRWRQSRIGAPE